MTERTEPTLADIDLDRSTEAERMADAVRKWADSGMVEFVLDRLDGVALDVIEWMPAADYERHHNAVEHLYRIRQEVIWHTQRLVPDWKPPALWSGTPFLPQLKAERALAVAEAKVARVEALADSLVWKRPDKCPCDDPVACCGSEWNCAAMRASVSVVGESQIRAALAGDLP